MPPGDLRKNLRSDLGIAPCEMLRCREAGRFAANAFPGPADATARQRRGCGNGTFPSSATGSGKVPFPGCLRGSVRKTTERSGDRSLRWAILYFLIF